MLNNIPISQLESIAGIIIFLVMMTVLSRFIKKKPRKKKKHHYSLYDKQQIFTDQTKREIAVKNATFEKRNLLNKGETFTLKYIQKILQQYNLPYHIYPQVPLMAFIQETTMNALQLQKGLRPDFILTDDHQNVVAVIEVNGTGHHEKFDHTKEMILNSVGIDVINIDTNGWNRLAKISYESHVVQKTDFAIKKYFKSL